MKHLRSIFRLLILLLIFACSQNNSESANIFTNDNDGDGVSNQQEAVDNTDPEDPCSVNINSQYEPAITDTWKQLDCDGDGVTNQQELIDGTLLLDPNWDLCDFNPANQDVSITSDFWKSIDCDGDGVTNWQEVSDGTNTKDHCDFVYTSQNSQPINGWTELDCDNDGRTNEEEINANTDPTDPNDFPGKGDKIVSIDGGEYTYLFEQNGTVYDKIVDENNIIITDFSYDAQGNLTSVFIKGYSASDNDINYTFSYSNNLISQIVRTEGTDQITYNVIHNGNIIYLDYGNHNLPTGYYPAKYTFNSNNTISTIENYSVRNGNELVYFNNSFEYNGPNGDLSRSYREKKYYNTSTQVYTDLTNTLDESTFSVSYSYHNVDAKNPMYNAIQKIYTHFILAPGILKRCYTEEFSAVSYHYVGSVSWVLSADSHQTIVQYSFTADNIQPNGFPVKGSKSSLGLLNNLDFYYEE